MAILSVTTDFTGQVGVSPRLVRVLTTDSYADVTAENYLQSAISMGYTFSPNDLVELTYGSNSDTTKIFSLSVTNDSITLIPPQGSVSGSTTADDIAIFSDTTGTLEDSGVDINDVVTVSGTPSSSFVAYWTGTGNELGVSQADINDVIITTSTSGQNISVTANSATPGNINNLTGAISNTATTQTSGTLIGVLGQATVPSGKTAGTNAALYGVQGSCVISGTVNGASATVSGLHGTLDISSATLTNGIYSLISADAGASGPNTTINSFNLISVNNSTATTSNSHIQTIGKATSWVSIDDSSSGFISSAGGSIGANPVKIKCLINGATKYFIAADNWT